MDEKRIGAESNNRINVALTITLLRIVAGIALCIAVPVFSVPAPYSIALYAAGGLFAGVEFLVSGLFGFAKENYFNQNTTLLVVFVISFIIGVGYEGALLLIFAQLGMILTEYVRKISREHVIRLTGLDFKQAHVFRGGLLVDNYLEDILSGDEIVVRAGEYFPVDCVVIEGNSTAKPQLIDSKCAEYALNLGAHVLAGTLNIGADVRCEVISESSSTATDILTVLRKAETNQMPAVLKYFQPFMMVFALIAGVLLVVLTDVDAYEAVHRALAMVALSGVASIYAGFGDIRFAARAGAASRGAVFSDDRVFTELGTCETAVICADGILTEGKLRVSAAYSETMDEDSFMRVAAHAMAFSSDPAAEAILNAYDGDIIFEDIQDFREIPNCGVMVVYKGTPVVLGTQALMANVKGLLPKKMSADRQIMFLLVGKQYAGYIVLTDPVSPLCDNICETLGEFGTNSFIFVTSYSGEIAEKISARSGITAFKSGFACDERIQYVEQLRDADQGKIVYFYHEKYAGEKHSAADYDVSFGGKTADLLEGRTELISTAGRKNAVFEGLQTAKCALQMCNASAWCMIVIKLLLVMFAGAGVVTVWFAAAFELLTVLFVKVFSVNAFEEQKILRFHKKRKLDK